MAITDLAAHAETLSPAQLRALKFGADPQTREIGYPKKTVFRTVKAPSRFFLKNLI